jgi:hypothetical protein
MVFVSKPTVFLLMSHHSQVNLTIWQRKLLRNVSKEKRNMKLKIQNQEDHMMYHLQFFFLEPKSKLVKAGSFA